MSHSTSGRRSRLTSLRIRVALLVLLAVLPAVVLSLYTAAVQRRDDIAAAQDTALRVARRASSEQARRLAGAHELLVTLAQLPDVRHGHGERCDAVLRRLLNAHDLYVNFGVIAPDGRVLCSALPVPEDTNLADRTYFRRAVATRGFALGDHQIGRITGRATINVAQPIEDGGAIVGVVFAAIDLAALNKIVVDAGLPAGATLTIVDGQGTILVRHPHAARWIGKTVPEAPTVSVVRAVRTGVAEAVNLDGVPALLGFTPLLDRPDSGDVYVSIGIPAEAAVAGANRQLRLNLLVLAVAAALGFGAAFGASSAFVLRPIDGLVNGARRVAAGDLSVRVPERGGREIAELTSAFNEMTAALARDRAVREETQRQLEAQRESLHRSERLAAIGRLAAGVAHELRNPLAVVGGRVELLTRALASGEVPDGAALTRHVSSLADASERMQSIMQSLSTASKPPKPEPQTLELAQLLAAVRALVVYEAHRTGVEIQVDVPESALTASGDRSHLIQVLLNLTSNAIEAMHQRGGQVVLRARRAADTGRPVLEVADTGPGIPPERVERIWDAFYTTKAEGTGLGLAIVRSLVEENGGRIDVTSEVGRGTVFTIVLAAAGR
jgi:signal transduction histidine kinase